MSHSVRNQRKTTKMITTTIVLFFIIFIAILASGCSVPATATPDPEASSATQPSEAPKEEEKSTPVFGDTVTYEDGLSISASVPSEYVPTEMAAGMVEGQPVVLFELVLTNNTDEPFDPVTVFATAASGGTEASGVFDTSNNVGFPPTTSVLPGATVKWNQAWSVADPNNITLEVSVGFVHDAALFVNSK